MVKMTFDPEVAKAVGTDEAIIYSNIQYWVYKNKANGKHFFDGRYWTYNSSKAFTEIFTWLSPHQIRRCLKKLENNGFIFIGNFNQNKFDRSMWYSDAMEATESNVPFDGIVKSEVTESSNPTNDKPDIKPDQKPNVAKSRFRVPTLEEVKEDFESKGLSLAAAKIEATKFWNFYDSKNWMVGKTKMKKWKSAVSGWIARNKKPVAENGFQNLINFTTTS